MSIELLAAGEPGYESARAPAIARFAGIRPAAVARCTTSEDVAEAISLAGRQGLVAVPRSGGHCFAGRSSTEGMLIDVGPMRSVSVSGDVVTVGAGTRLGDLYDALGSRTIPAGCGPTVGIAGLTLGGGFGILGRRYGLSCDHLTAARVVLANGRVVDCSERREPDLFWALRGAGGGQFGVVTSLTFTTVPAPDATAFHLVWPGEQATRVIAAWQSVAPDATDELAASLLVVAAGEAPVVNVFGAMLGTGSDATAALGPLVDRAGADPVSARTSQLSFQDTKRWLVKLGDAMTGNPEGHSYSKSEYFARPLPADAVTGLVARLDQGRVPGEVREMDFSPWGGAYNRVPAAATAFAHRDARFLLKQAVTTPAPEHRAARRWLADSWSLAHPFGTGGVYPNFPDPELTGWAHAYHGANYPRLRQVKARYDPAGFFRFPQAIPAGKEQS